MDDASINAIAGELQSVLAGSLAGKIFQIDQTTLVIDFRSGRHATLLISANPSLPRLYLTKRRLRDLEKQSVPLGQFALTLRKHLNSARLVSIEKDANDRVIRFTFSRADAAPATQNTLIAQLTGRSTNLFLVDDDERLLHRLRSTETAGQQIGKRYHRPAQTQTGTESKTALLALIQSGRFDSPSEAAEQYYDSLDSEQRFDRALAAAQARLKTELRRQKTLLKKLEADLGSHAGAETNKRIGDLLLANAANARRAGRRVTLIDYFDADIPSVEIEVDEKLTLPEEASRRFAQYSRSKRAIGQIESRIESVKQEIAKLTTRQHELDRIAATRDEAALARLAGGAATAPGQLSGSAGSAGGRKRSRDQKIPGTRRYISSDGFEVLVGRAAKDNDFLTFKVARPNDLWLHSGDYPGSHVIIRNATRKEIPHKTIVEAAQLAAHFSQANKNAKVDVHYTPRKFLLKPKGAAPGLVRMSRFKTITVEPRELSNRVLDR